MEIRDNLDNFRDNLNSFDFSIVACLVIFAEDQSLAAGNE